MINNNMINNNMIDNKINNLHELDINNLDELAEWFDKAAKGKLGESDSKLISQNIKKLKDNDVNMDLDTLLNIYDMGYQMFNLKSITKIDGNKTKFSFHYNLNDLEQGTIASPKDLYDVLEKYTYKFLNDDNVLDILALRTGVDKKEFEDSFLEYWLYRLKCFEEIKDLNRCSSLFFMDRIDI